MTEIDLRRFMASHKLGVLGSIGPEGKPQAALVGIATTPELGIVFDTTRSTRKYSNLIERPFCSFVIGGWGKGELTVQYEGEAEELRSPTLEIYREIYFGVYPDGRDRMKWPGIVYFLVLPKWIRFTDFDASPPVVQMFTF